METIEEKLARLEEKIDSVYISSEKSRKYLLIILIGTLIMFLLPLIMGAIMLPFMMSTLGNIYTI
jgi:hypothetical protein